MNLTLLDYILYQLKRMGRALCISNAVVVVLWVGLYYLTDWNTVANYVWIGIAVCALNTLLYNIRRKGITELFRVQYSWIIMAGAVLVLYHAGFAPAAVFVAAAIMVSPLFWASMYEGVVGLSLLVTLALLMT